jgi:hypothetical protein
MITDVLARIGSILVDPDVKLDESGKEPATYEPGTLYVFNDGDVARSGAETGPPGREAFDVLAVYMASDRGEEARQERTAEVTAVLLSRRDAYIARLQQRESCDLWDHIAVSSDEDYTTNFEGRAVAVRIQGYRHR